MKKILLIIILCLSLVFVACDSNDNTENESIENLQEDEMYSEESENNEDIKDESVEEESVFDLSDFSTIDIYGESIDSSIFEGKYTLVNVWATWCNPCVVEIPDLIKLNENIDSENYQVIGIIGDTYTETEENIEEAKEIVETLGITYTNIVPNDEIGTEVMSKIQYFPTSFIVDENGQVVGDVVFGAKDYDFFEAWLSSVK